MSEVDPELTLSLTRGDRKGRFEIVNEGGRLFVPIEALGWFLDEVDDRMCAIADRLDALEGGVRPAAPAGPAVATARSQGASDLHDRDLITGTGGYDYGSDMFNGTGGFFS